MADVQGYTQLQARLHAVGNVKVGEAMMKRLGLTVVREAKLIVPRKTGNLGRSIGLISVTPNSATVAATANYAGFVEFGTGAHEITPKAKKALRFAATAGGRRLSGSPRKGADVVFAKRVHHPGTRAHPYMVPAVRIAASKSGMTDVVVEAWNGAA